MRLRRYDVSRDALLKKEKRYKKSLLVVSFFAPFFISRDKYMKSNLNYILK